MPVPFISKVDGQRMLVSTLVKQPALVPARILNMMDQMFLVDAILRPGPPAPSGVIVYNESTPLFADDASSVVEEFGEIPVVSSSLGIPRTVRAVRRGMALKISQDMIDEENFDAVNTRMIQIRNTFRRDWEDAFLAAVFANPAVPTQAVTGGVAWATSTTIRKDLNAARKTVELAAADAAGNQKFGFNADTLIIGTGSKYDFLNSDDVAKVYLGGNLASENLQYTGKLPNKFLDLDIVTSWRMPTGKALLLERKTIGGVSDKRPLRSTNLYEHQPTETWRSDTTRASAIFIDQPLSACIITGV
jgi:hypothetical protein